MYQTVMFDNYDRIQTFCHAGTVAVVGDYVSKNYVFLQPFCCEVPCHKIICLLLCTVSLLISDFVTATECLLVNLRDSTLIALLKHGFLLVKTWLLIPRCTAFYAIIAVLYSDKGESFFKKLVL